MKDRITNPKEKDQTKNISNRDVVSLVFGILLIIIIQCVFYFNSSARQLIPTSQTREDASGLSYENAKQYLHFYYYLDLFPIVFEDKETYEGMNSAESAANLVASQGESLLNDVRASWARKGHNARIFTLLPNAIISRSTDIPSVTLFNATLFTAGLISIFISSFIAQKRLLGLILVAIVGSTPFFLYEVYVNQDIFALTGSVALLLFGLFIPAILNQRYTLIWLTPFISGSLIGLASSIRAEAIVLLISCTVLYMFIKIPALKKITLAALLFLTFFLTIQLISSYFNAKFAEAEAFVTEAGGTPYTWDRIQSHTLWHPIYCGLGDFDSKYGYDWDDRAGYTYAVPILNEKYGLDLQYSGGYALDECYDKECKYQKDFDEIREYDLVLRDKVMHDISHDPIWYTRILTKRVISVLSNTSLAPLLGWLLIPFCYLVVKNKTWEYLLVLSFFIPLSFNSLFIYSGKGATFGSMYHLIVLSVLTYWFLNWITPKITHQLNDRPLTNNSRS